LLLYVYRALVAFVGFKAAAAAAEKRQDLTIAALSNAGERVGPCSSSSGGSRPQLVEVVVVGQCLPQQQELTEAAAAADVD
jgi:hypothetical protein